MFNKRNKVYQDSSSAEQDRRTVHSGASSNTSTHASKVQEEIFVFLGAFKTKPYFATFDLIYLSFLIQTALVYLHYKYPFGSFNEIFRILHYIRSLGTEHLGYLPLTYILIGIIVAELCLVVLVVLTYRAYSQGVWYFSYLKNALIFLSVSNLFLCFPMIHIMTTFWDCHPQTNLHVIYGTSCVNPEKIFYGIAGIIGSLGVTLFAVFSIFSYADTSVGGWTALLNVDRVYFLAYECASVLILYTISRAVYMWEILLPILLLVQGLIGLVFLFYDMPFFRTSTNCAAFGWLLARVVASVINIITIAMNSDLERTGWIMAIVTLVSFPLAFIVGFILGFVYTRIIIVKSKSIDIALRNNEMPTLDPRYLIIALRLTCTNEKSRSAYERALIQLSQTKHESVDIYIMLSTVAIYFKKDATTIPLLYLKKAMGLRPSFVKKFIIFLRTADFEATLGEQSDTRKIYKILERVKKNDSRTIFFVKQFWKEALDSKNMNVSKMASIAMQLENSVSNSEQLLNNLLLTYPKNVTVLRTYANFLETIKQDKETADIMYAEADGHEDENTKVYDVMSKVDEKQMDDVADNRGLDSMLPESALDMNSKTSAGTTRLHSIKKSILQKDNMVCCVATVASMTLVIIIYMIVILIILNTRITSSDNQRLLAYCEMINYAADASADYLLLSTSLASNESIFRDWRNQVQNWKEHTLELQETVALLEKHENPESNPSFFNTQYLLTMPIVFNASATTSNISYYKTNITALQASYLLQTATIEFSKLTPQAVYNNSIFWAYAVLWRNQDVFASMFTKLCLDVLNGYLDKVTQNIQTVIYTGTIVVAFHAIYFAVFIIPAVGYLLLSRKSIIRLFTKIPKEVTGKIYQDIQERDDNEHKYVNISNPTTIILICCLIVLMIEAAAVGFLWGLSISTIVQTSGSSEVTKNAAFVNARAMNVLNQVLALGLKEQRVPFDQRSNLQTAIVQLKDDYASLTTGINTKSGVGILNKDASVDSYFRFKCDPNQINITCSGSSLLIDDFVVKAQTIGLKHEYLSSSDTRYLIKELNVMQKTFEEQIISAANEYAMISTKLGISVDRNVVFGFAIGLIILMTYPLYQAMTKLLAINQVLRLLFMYIPPDVIASNAQLLNYIEHYNVDMNLCSCLKRKKQKTEEGNIMEASTDGVVICTDAGIVMEINKSAQNLFAATPQEMIGLNLKEFFVEAAISGMIKDVLAGSQSVKKELNGKKKKTGAIFPCVLSMGVGKHNNRRVLVAFAKDMTIEKKQTELIQAEQKRAESLLLNILPTRIAARLKKGETSISEKLDDVTIMFTDMVGFTSMSSKISASELVELLNKIVQGFDDICMKYGLEKIKTIGDAYFLVGGLEQDSTDHPERVMRCALDMLDYLQQSDIGISIRVGIHTGPVVAGVIGKTKFAYDLWGSSVNLASRMESTGVPGAVQCTRETYSRIHDLFEFEERSNVTVKGAGTMTTYICTGEKKKAK